VKVFVVVDDEGDTDDVRIVGVFSTYDRADNRAWAAGYSIEEFDLDDGEDPPTVDHVGGT
jgi:hypothetical protein